MLHLGTELLAPYVRADADGQPLYALPGAPHQLLPYLAYAPGAYLGRAVDQMLKQSSTPVHLDRIYETDMAEGLKAMALEGHGIAFLPPARCARRCASASWSPPAARSKPRWTSASTANGRSRARPRPGGKILERPAPAPGEALTRPCHASA